MAKKPTPKPEPIPATYRRGNFVSADPRAFEAMPPGEPPAILRARKPQPEPASPTSDGGASAWQIVLFVVAILVIIWAVLLLPTHP